MIRLVITLLIVAHSLPAIAQDVALTIVRGGTCPGRDQVADALDKLAPKSLLVTDSEHAALSVEVTDLGDRYRVVGGFDKVIDDPTRRCDERARAVALIVALALDSLPAPPLPMRAPEPPLPPAKLQSPRPGPLALIDRPLVLPWLHTQIGEELTVATFSSSAGRATGFTETTSADLGVGRKVQLGLLAAAPLTQSSGDVTLIPRLTVGLHRDVALRIELGFYRTHAFDADSNFGVLNGGFLGLTLLTRVRVHRMFSITFGDTGQRTEWPASLGKYGSDLLAVTSHALLAITADAAFFNASVCLPIGVLFQPHPMVAMQVTVGVRLRFDQYGLIYDATGFPLSFDLVVSPHRNVDLGLALDLPMQINGPANFVESALFVRSRF